MSDQAWIGVNSPFRGSVVDISSNRCISPTGTVQLIPGALSGGAYAIEADCNVSVWPGASGDPSCVWTCAKQGCSNLGAVELIRREPPINYH